MTFVGMSQCMYRFCNRDDEYQVVEEFKPGCFADLYFHRVSEFEAECGGDMQDIFALAGCCQKVGSDKVAQIQIERQMPTEFIADLDAELGPYFSIRLTDAVSSQITRW